MAQDKHPDYIVLAWPRSGTAYGTEEYAIKIATEQVLANGGVQTVWRRVATVRPEPKVIRDNE